MGKPKLLLIEDNKEIVEMYLFKFKKEGFEVVVGETGQEGMEKAEKEHPDLILLDILLPNTDGYEVLVKLRAMVGVSVPIIMFSNLGQEDQIKKGLNLGATDYIVKANFTPTEVVAKIKSYLPVMQV
ncbi:MAG: response regulator [bacterium]